MQAIAHNLLSQFTDRQLNITVGNKSKSTEKLSSGFRINRAGDDAAGLAISEKMRWQVRGLKRGQQNIQDGVSWLQIADGAMEELSKMIGRIRELSVQASNDTNTPSDRAAIDNEISELKKEINNICKNAQFNTQDIFDNSYVSMDVFGMPCDLQVFDATYDDVTGDYTYGGFVFHGERYTWDVVGVGVSIDASTGKQIFTGGDYSFTDTNGDYFNISCEPGDTVPTITRKLDFSADPSGITIDGKTLDWENLIDEEGVPFSASNVHGGAWSIDYEGAVLAFFVDVADDVSDMVDAIASCNNGKVTYSWETKLKEEKEVKGVDAEVVKDIRISNAFAQNLASGDKVSYTVRAGDGTGGTQNGIWLEKSDGSTVNGSFHSWADLGIHSWDSGHDISSQITYTYTDDDGVNDTLLSFDFYLSDITSIDSVIDGLDGMVIKGENIITNYSTNVQADLGGNVQKVTAQVRNPISFEDELALGRDFEQQTIDNFIDEKIAYDENNHNAAVSLGSSGIDFTGSTVSGENRMEVDLRTYAAYVLRQKQMLALSGANPQDGSIQLGSGSLTDLVGAGKVTTSGHFSEVVTLTAGMELSDGGEAAYFKPGEAGKSYPAACIDFSGLGSGYTVDSLLGLGFNSTCKTCDNHYSVLFTDGATDSVSQDGYQYSYRPQGSRDYLLQIDINSLKANGVATGADLAKAIVDITSDCFDFHYTQYAADGNKLWVYDNRTQSVGTKNATFDTAPHYAIDTDVFDFSLKTDDGRYINVSYTYDYGDIAENIVVEMKEAALGSYVQENGGYVLYDNTNPNHINAQRYDMNISYKKADGSTCNNLGEVIEDYKTFALKDMLENTSVQLDVNDYTYMDMKGDEKPNVAIQAVFDSELIETPYENGLYIQNSSLADDKIKIPRFAMNTVVLRLYRAGTKDFEQAQDSIGYCDYALEKLLSKRCLYGAYQNRLEHTYQVKSIEEENSQAAESRIRDTNMVTEMVNQSKQRILEQAGEAMLAQANQFPNGILQIL